VPTRQRTWALIGVLVAVAAITKFLLDGDPVAGSLAAGAIFGALTFAFFALRASLVQRRERQRSSSTTPD
jgi:hypothetical protein